MSLIKLSYYGLNLSGRPFGIQTYQKIKGQFQAPYSVDFEGVFSIGSSFADEVIAKLAEENGGTITVYNSSRVIDRCLEEVAKDNNFVIEKTTSKAQAQLRSVHLLLIPLVIDK